MGLFRKIKDSAHYDRLKNSVQYRYDRRQLLILSGCFGFVMLLYLPLIILSFKSAAEAPAALFLCMFWGIALLFLWIFYAYRWLEIFLHIDSYIFCPVKLDQPHIEGRGGAHFTVEFTDRHGKRLQRDTSKMFSSQWEPFLEEYNNQTVLIGYNEETDRVVVIGLENG